jgi:sigma-E factor negative regulatory protein RseB
MARPAVLLPALVGLGFSMGAAFADPLEQDQALVMLQRVADAARELNYAGTFVYQHGEQVETSRIIHLVERDNEIEKLETLDGPRREIIRNNDEVLCYYPEAKIVRSEKRLSRRTFPALLPEQLTSITENYQIRRGATERIAGYDSQALILEPRDGLRYGHKFWADVASGLLLKARMVDDRHHVVEQFSFTQLTIGRGVTPDMVKPTYDAVKLGWRIDRFGADPGRYVDSGWSVGELPAGFRKIMEMRRTKQGNAVQATHLVYSDGLAAVSVFIEPATSRSRVNEGLSRQGAINIYSRTLNDQVITVLGETPAATVKQIGDSISLRAK